MSRRESIWSEYRHERLVALWAEGLTTREIGRQLNCTKNAVIGRAFRADLPRRRPPRALPPPRVVPAWYAQLGVGCGYDLGAEDGFNFCCAPVQPGSSLCAEHHALCWFPPPKKRIAKVAAA
jgi:GcrA cell cycle regulator